MLRHADSRSTERYAKLGDPALVSVIRPRPRRVLDSDVDPMWIQGKSGLANPSLDNEFWRGGRDSNPRISTITARNSWSRRGRAHGVLMEGVRRTGRRADPGSEREFYLLAREPKGPQGMTKAALREEYLKLSLDERMELGEEVWDSIAAESEREPFR